MTDKPDHLPSRELIKQTGIRAKDVTPLLELVVSSKSLSPQLISWIGFSGKPDALGSRDRGKVRWYLRRDLSRCKWIFDDLMNEAKGSVYPSTVKEQRKQIAESAQDLLKNMEKS